MNIETALQRVQKQFPSSTNGQERLRFHPFEGGTSSTVGRIRQGDHELGVLKLGEPEGVRSEVAFLRQYVDQPLFPKLIHVDPDFTFIVYAYVRGESSYRRGTKGPLLQTLARDVLSHYREYVDAPGWGWLDAPAASWGEFLATRLRWARESVEGHLSGEDYALAQSLAFAQAPNLSSRARRLVHGDFGVHNFLFEGDKLTGVIDPLPALGPPLFDLAYAFCSSPDQLEWELVREAANLLPNPPTDRALWETVVIELYNRIATCLQWHRVDLADYLDAWRSWSRDER